MDTISKVSNGFSLDPLVLVSVLGGFIGMAVGLMTIWSQVRTAKREQKKDIENTIISSEDRLKEFFDLKLQVVDEKIDNVKEVVKNQDIDYKTRLSEHHNFFRDWIQRIEDEIDPTRHRRTKK